MAHKRLQDRDGNESSKRFNGTYLIWLGSFMAILAYGIALFHPLGDSNFILKIIAIILGLGSGLDGLGIFDGVFGRKK
jgi:hypothetical protein